MILKGADFSIIEAYYMLGFLSFPSIIIIVSGLILMKRGKYLIARVNINFVELYVKRNMKQINIRQITKIIKISSSQGTFFSIIL